MHYFVHQKDQFKPTGRKAAPKILLNLTPWGNLTKALQAAFTCADLKSAKNTVKSSVLLAILGFVHEKAARKTLVKLTSGWVLNGKEPSDA